MPAPAAVAAYVAAAVGTVAAAVAFKEFVYEPHIAPKLERWAEEYLARRRARRGEPVAVPVEMQQNAPSRRYSDEQPESEELQNLVAREVFEWRDNVEPHHNGEGSDATMHRRRPWATFDTLLDESVPVMTTPHIAIEPTHILCGSRPLSPLSTQTTSPTVPNQTQSFNALLPTPTLSSSSPSIHAQESSQWLHQESGVQERPSAPTPLLSPMFSPVVPLHNLAQPITDGLPAGPVNDVLVENESPFSHVLDAISPHLSSNELDSVPSPIFHEFVVDSDDEQGQNEALPLERFQSVESQETLSDGGEFLSPGVTVEHHLFGHDDSDSDSDSAFSWTNADIRSP